VLQLHHQPLRAIDLGIELRRLQHQFWLTLEGQFQGGGTAGEAVHVGPGDGDGPQGLADAAELGQVLRCSVCHLGLDGSQLA